METSINTKKETASTHLPSELESNNDLESIGSYLKKARHEKGLTLRAISAHTKINKTILENLENNNLKELPNKAYVVGFVKSYSKALGLSQKLGLKLLESTYNQQSDKKEDSFVLTIVPKETEKHKEKQDPSFILPLVFFTILVLASFYLYTNHEKVSEQISSKKTEEKIIIGSETLNPKTPLKENNDSFITPTQVKENDPIIEENEIKTEEIIAVKEVEKKEEKVLVNGEWPDRNFYKTSKELYNFSFESKDKEGLNDIPNKYKVLPAEGNKSLLIHALDDDNWLTYQVNNESIKRFILKQGNFLRLEGEIIKITFGNVKKARIYLDNIPLSIPSRTGVTSIIIPQDRKKDFYFPPFIYSLNGQKVITSDEYMAQKDELLSKKEN